MKDEKPGVYPFTRGIYSNMYKDRLWTMRQYAGLTSAKESNKRYHSLLTQGVMGLSVAFDLPTQIGYDSDNNLAVGEVGKVGVPISSIENMEQLSIVDSDDIFLLRLNKEDKKHVRRSEIINGDGRFSEIGPLKVLQGLSKRIDRSLIMYGAESYEDILNLTNV